MYFLNPVEHQFNQSVVWAAKVMGFVSFSAKQLLTAVPGRPCMPLNPLCPLWPLSPASPASPLSPFAPAGPCIKATGQKVNLPSQVQTIISSAKHLQYFKNYCVNDAYYAVMNIQQSHGHQQDQQDRRDQQDPKKRENGKIR